MMEFQRTNNTSDEDWMNKVSASMNQSVDQELLRRLRASNGNGPSSGMGNGPSMIQQQDQQGRNFSQQSGNGGNGQGSEQELLLQLLYERRRRQGMGGPGDFQGDSSGLTGGPMTNLLPTDEEKLQKLRDQQQAASVVSRRNSLMGGSGGNDRRTSMLGSLSENSGSNLGGGPNSMIGNRTQNQGRGAGSVSPFNPNNPMMGGAGGGLDGARRASMMGGMGNMGAPAGAMFNGMGGLNGMGGMGNMGGLAGMGGINGMGGMMDAFHQDPFGPMGVSSSQSAEYLNPQRVDLSSSRLLALQRQHEAAGMMGMQPGLFSAMNGVHPNAVGSSFLMDRERMMDLNLYGHTREQLAQAQAHTEKLLLREQLQQRQLQQGQMQNVNIKKKRAPARKKTPTNKPRRPLSAYNLFFSEERERILKEIDEKAALERGEDPKKDTAGEKDGEKKEDKSADGDDKAEENKDSDESKEGEDKKRKIPKAFLRPLLPGQRKRRAHRKTHGKISFRMLAQMVGARWKALPDDERKYYQDLAKEDSIRQKEAMKEYYRMEQRQQEDPTGSTIIPESETEPTSSGVEKIEPEPIAEDKDEVMVTEAKDDEAKAGDSKNSESSTEPAKEENESDMKKEDAGGDEN